jgi:hypothetical protein
MENVVLIEQKNVILRKLTAFPDTPQGMKAAAKAFRKRAKECQGTPKHIAEALKDFDTWTVIFLEKGGITLTLAIEGAEFKPSKYKS